MVPTDTPRKRTLFLVIALTILTLHVGTTQAATKAAVKKSVPTKQTVVKKTSSASASTKKTTSKKTTKKTKKKGKVAKQVKASIIAADRAMVLSNDGIPTSSLLATINVQTPTTSSMVVTNPVTSDTYSIIVTTPKNALTYDIPANDIRGYYAQPISGKLSQGIHDVNAVDISAPVGSIVHAAASGIVIAIANGDSYSGGYGNYIIISHPNGTETLYAHLSYASVKVGDVVSQGQPIAFSGRTGKVTGAHLHFEVRGATNPWGSDSIGTLYSI